MKNEEKKRLTISKPRERGKRPVKVYYWTNPESYEALHSIRGAYRQALGRECSVSVITRRALKLLAQRLEAVNEVGSDAMEIEIAQLLRCVR